MLQRKIVLGISMLLLALGATACGGGDVGGANEAGSGQTVPDGQVGDTLEISQWPLYVDPGKDGTVAQFERDTGINVNYHEDINDNSEFFAKLQPLLQEGESGGRDSITVSDWLARKMYDLGYIYKLDKSKLPNVEDNLI